MRFKNPLVQKFWKFSTSFQLGIPVLVALTILIMWGTIVESQYDAFAAEKLVYRSWMMYLTMGLLVYNLAIVVVDRMPWKSRHIPFILVHAGIILIVVGGYVTQKYGLDGSMMLPINGKNNYVQVAQTDVVVYATFDGDRYTKVFENEVDFFLNPPTEDKPFKVNLGDAEITVKKYLKYARVSKKLKKSTDANAGASVKFQLQNANVQQVETLTQNSKTKTADVNFGPLKVVLGHDVKEKGRKDRSTNEIYFNAKNETEINYELYRKEEMKSFKSGSIKIGDIISTGWMGLELRLLDYLPQATEEWDAVEVGRPTPLTSPALLIQFGDKTQWTLLNDVIKLFGDNEAFLFSFQNRRMDIGFPVVLKKFEMTHYDGTQKAKTYSSAVEIVPPNGNAPVSGLIAMNEPLKYAGYTFYQASFNQDEKTGEPTASVLSVNLDPGRWIKYLGSLVLSLGIVWLFVQTRRRKTAQ
ncbi:MAG: cytochrome c biogenesis protein ResB [Pseudobdellovibrio sp.]|nr:cytochrome c biogenesis protein ResB [Pseudobdellovibrio sp.]